MRQAAADAGVELARAINRLGGRRDVYRRMLGNFVAELQAMPALLAQQAAAGGTGSEFAARTLHTLKGGAATLGAAALAAAAAQAEKRVLAEPTRCAAVTGTVAAAIASALPLLKALHAALDGAAPAPAASPVDRAQRLALLQQLQPLLAASDMQATALAERLRGQADAELDALADSVEQLDFAAALQRCRGLLHGVSA